MGRKPKDALATLRPLLDAGSPTADTLRLASNAGAGVLRDQTHGFGAGVQLETWW